MLFSIAAASFDLEEGLSPEVNAALPMLIDHVVKRIYDLYKVC